MGKMMDKKKWLVFSQVSVIYSWNWLLTSRALVKFIFQQGQGLFMCVLLCI